MTRKELWYCMRRTAVGQRRVRLLEDMYQNSKTEVRCVVGVRDGFKQRHTHTL